MCQFLRYQSPLRVWVLPAVFFLTSKEQFFAPVRWWRKSTKYSQIAKLPLLMQSMSRKLCPDALPDWPRMMQKSQILSKSLAALQPVLPHWKRMQRPSPVVPARQDRGTSLDMMTALQPLGLSGPMAQGHLMTIEIHDDDLIRSQAPKMNNHEVPCYYGSLANNTTLGLRIGSITFRKNPRCQHPTNLSEFIAMQVPCQPDSYSKRVKCQDFVDRYRDDGIPLKSTVFSATPKQLSRSANPSHLKTGKSENNLRLCGKFWPNSSKFSSPTVTAQVPLLSLRSRPLKFSASRIAPFGSGQLFALLAPDLCVPGVPGEVL